MDKDKSLVQRPSASSFKPSWRLLAVGGVCSGLMVFLFWGSPKHGSSQDVTPASQRVLPVKTQTLRLKNQYTLSRTYSGEIAARRVSDIGFEVTGTLVDFPIKEGDRVQKGAILARLDTRSLIAQKKQLIAQRRQAEAQLNELVTGPRQEEIGAAQATVQDLKQQAILADQLSDRGKVLFDQGAVAREFYEERLYNARSLRNRQEQAQQRLDELKAGTRIERVASQDAQIAEIDARMEALDIERSKTQLVAPFSGRVAQKLVSEGVVLNSGQAILRVVESGPMEARIGVPQSVANRMKMGQTLPIQVGQEQYSAVLTAILPEIEETSRTVTVLMEFTPRSPLTIGQTAQLVWTQTEDKNGFWLPTTAIVAGEKGLWSVYVLQSEPQRDRSNSTYTVARRDVEVLHTESERVFVRGLISPGDKVVSQGKHRLVQG